MGHPRNPADRRPWDCGKRRPHRSDTRPATRVEDRGPASVSRGAAIAAAPVADTLKRVDDGTVTATIDRTGLWGAQTPQTIRRELLLDLFAKVGDRYVLEELHRHGWILGGEGSGHLLVLDKQTTGDGLVSALQVLQTCVRSGRAMADLLRDVQLFPQTLINVRLQPGQDWQSNTRLQAQTQQVQAELGERGRVLIRASGTEPLVRIMVEADDAARARSVADHLAAEARRIADCTTA